MNNQTPLTPAVFHILLALSTGERHGYAIMKEVETDSQGKVRMGAGTLYGSLKRMLDAGLVVESDKRADPDGPDMLEMSETSGTRRIYYKITGAGERALAEELDRLRHLVTITNKRELLPKTFAYGG